MPRLQSDIGRRQGQRVERVFQFSRHLQQFARRDQRGHVGTLLEQIADKTRGLHDLLEIVQHEQADACSQRTANNCARASPSLLRGMPSARAMAAGTSATRDHARQFDQPHAMLILRHAIRRHLQRQARFARPSRPCNRNQALLWVFQQGAEFLHLALAAHETRQLRGKVMPVGRQGVQGGIIGRGEIGVTQPETVSEGR